MSARPTWRSASGMALLGVAVLAVIELVLLGFVVASQRDGAHIIDISGAQRMRTQRIAFLAVAARSGMADPGWRAELLDAVRQTRAVRRELVQRKFTRVGQIGADGYTPLGRISEPYLRAAKAIARNPRDAAALALIRHYRLPLLRAFDDNVRVRSARFQRQGNQTVAAISVALAALFGGVIVAWFGVLIPAERRTREAITALVDSRRQFSSLFHQNPEAIAVYDLSGRVVRGNAAAAQLLGDSAELRSGAHFSSHLAPESLAAAEAGFRSAASGGTAAFETLFLGSGGQRIDAAINLFPHVVDGTVAGVVGVARDLRALKRAQASFDEQSDRIAALYTVASGSARPWKLQIGEALSLAGARLGYGTGFVAEVVAGTATLVVSVGNDAALPAGLALPLEVGAAKRTAASQNDVLACVAQHVWPADAERRARFVASGRSVPLVVSGQAFGVLCLADSLTAQRVLTQPDAAFLALVSALVGSSVERGRQENKLDTMAFYDSLTGLPNRVLLYDRLAKTIDLAQRAQAPFALHYVDLDGFKRVNDRFGHAVGDDVLQIAAKRMQGTLRTTDTVARIGGDEFVILQPGAIDRASAKDVADRVLAEISRPFIVDGVAHQLGASIGISIYPDDGLDGETLLQQADKALYNAKYNGRNQMQFVA